MYNGSVNDLYYSVHHLKEDRAYDVIYIVIATCLSSHHNMQIDTA